MNTNKLGILLFIGFMATAAQQLIAAAAADLQGARQKELDQQLLNATNHLNVYENDDYPSGTLQTILNLLNQGANVNARDEEGNTPFLNVSRSNFPSSFTLVKKFLEQGANVNDQDEEGNTPLIGAADFGDLRTLELLLNYQAEINHKNIYDETALFYAIGENSPAVVQFLIRKGADFTLKDRNGDAPLNVACYSCGDYGNRADIVRFLVIEGADVMATNNKGDTPLYQACKSFNSKNRLEIIKFLLENGANVMATNNEGNTPLHAACSSPCSENILEIVQLLVRNGANVMARNNKGNTPLHLASFHNNDSVVQYLLRFTDTSTPKRQRLQNKKPQNIS